MKTLALPIKHKVAPGFCGAFPVLGRQLQALMTASRAFRDYSTLDFPGGIAHFYQNKNNRDRY
jgi:hypothetical protein